MQDVTTVAFAVARLGKRCHEPALQGFEHVYSDILKQNIDVRELEFPLKEMEAKIKKMERYIGTTSNLYQELEILSELEQALRRAQDEDDAVQRESLYPLEQKVVWQRQEVKYLKDISLWNRTYDKTVGLLARTVCTTYGRIINVFGFPVSRLPEILSTPKNGEAPQLSFLVVSRSLESNISPPDSQAPQITHPDKSCSITVTSSNGLVSSSGGWNSGASTPNSTLGVSRNVVHDSYEPFCCSPGCQFAQEKKMNVESNTVTGHCRSYHVHELESSCKIYSDQRVKSIVRDSHVGNLPLSRARNIITPMNGPVGKPPVSSTCQNGGISRLLFNPRSRLQNAAPPSTLGGAALALHYANVIIVVERMVRYPHLISPDARDELYQMLPKNVRMSLRGKLRPSSSSRNPLMCDEMLATDWKEALDRILGWLAPLAHNMIRWQSEHNFEQQQVVSRTNVLLLQTLYFADQVKAERAITELLIGLNYIWRYEREVKATAFVEYASNKDLDEYLDWQL
eukprot:c23315_g2_i2 orf=3-1538(+)